MVVEKREKVVAMLSGGLDGVLAAKMMLDQGLDVVGLSLVSPFFDGCGNMAVEMGKQIGIEVILLDVGNDYFDMLRNPKFGYGSALNPCIDCKVYMFVKAKKLMEKIGALAVVTGEVLGQRPMSQRRDAMMKIAKESGLKGKLLRPLSAKYLPETDIEMTGIVDREKMLDITGRGRTAQIEMAEEIGLKGILCGTGGCLLTDKNIKDKLLDLFAHTTDITTQEVGRLNIGRHFRLENGLKFILGRNLGENDRLLVERKPDEIIIEPISFPGGTALVEVHPESRDYMNYISNVIRSFSKFTEGNKFTVEIIDAGGCIEEEMATEEVDYFDYWIGQKRQGE